MSERATYRKLPVVIEASQWFKNGDHPEVRDFRDPNNPGEETCKHCGATIHVHGWIDTLEGGHIVCPGDWIITGVKGEHYPCKPDVFALTYEPAASPALGADARPARFEMYEALRSIGVIWMANAEAGDGCASWVTITEPHGEEPAESLDAALQTILRATENDALRARLATGGTET